MTVVGGKSRTAGGTPITAGEPAKAGLLGARGGAGARAIAWGKIDRGVDASEADSDTAAWGAIKGLPRTGVAAMLRVEDAVAGGRKDAKGDRALLGGWLNASAGGPKSGASLSVTKAGLGTPGCTNAALGEPVPAAVPFIELLIGDAGTMTGGS